MVFLSFQELLSVQLNFSANMVPSFDGQWGIADANGTWNGMVGALVRKEADMCTAALSVLLERSRVIEYAIPLAKDIDTLSAR